MTTHELKSWPEFFEPVFTGVKTFELRNNDRKFRLNDVLVLREFDDRRGVYTGRNIRKRITYILEGVGSGGITPLHGLMHKYVILSLADCK